MSAIARLRWARRIDPPCPGRDVMRAVLAELVDLANTATGECDPSLLYLARATGYTQRAVQYATRRLDEYGFVQRKTEPGRITAYLVQFPGSPPKQGWDGLGGPPEGRRPTNRRSSVPTHRGSWGGRTAVRGGDEQPFVGGTNSGSSQENSSVNSSVNSSGEQRAERATPRKPSPYCQAHPRGGVPCNECRRSGQEYDQWVHRYGCRADHCGNPVDPDEPEYHYCTDHMRLAPSNRKRRTKEPE